MFESINEVAVLVSAILAIAVGSIWYSPLLFGKYWMRGAGLSETSLQVSGKKMVKLLSHALVANLLLLFVIAQFVELTKMLEQQLATTAILLILFLAAVSATAVIWEEKPFSYLFINVGYAAVVVFGGMTVLWHWPW
jgi:hypothetical protein